MIIDLDEAREWEESGISAARVKAYHCTRAFQSDIASEGLKRFNYAERVEYFRRHLQDYGVCEKQVDDYLKEVGNFLGYEELQGREGIVCFFLNRGFFEEDNEGEPFFQYFGGEAMYWMAKNIPRFGEVKTALENIGQPLIVTAVIEFRKIKNSHRAMVLKRLRGESTQNCEAFFVGDVPPSDILGIEVARKTL